MAQTNATLGNIMNMVTQMTNGMHGGGGMAGGEMHGDGTHGSDMHGADMHGGMNMHGGSMNMHDMNMNMHGGMNNGMTGMNGQMMMMDPMPDSFFFSKRTKDLVFQGWSVASDTQFILTLLAIFLVAILMEAGRRLTREMHQSITKSTKRSRLSWLYPHDPETSATSSDTNGRSQNPTHLEDNNMNCSKTESIPVTEEGKETKLNQDGVLESSSPDTPYPGDEHMQLMNEEHQDGSLKRNTSFELGANRWDTTASPTDENHLCEEAHKVTVSKKRKEFLKRLMVHSLVTVSHTSQLVIGYILMLVVMSYNVWLLIAVVTGATIGYLLFSWDRIKVAETGGNLVSHDHSRVPTSTVV